MSCNIVCNNININNQHQAHWWTRRWGRCSLFKLSLILASSCLGENFNCWCSFDVIRINNQQYFVTSLMKWYLQQMQYCLCSASRSCSSFERGRISIPHPFIIHYTIFTPPKITTEYSFFHSSLLCGSFLRPTLFSHYTSSPESPILTHPSPPLLGISSHFLLLL